ncbi:hypothetical protein SERLA73DRAFT_183742, partial [Serpula lacrymans var. lacrymans S7.3]
CSSSITTRHCWKTLASYALIKCPRIKRLQNIPEQGSNDSIQNDIQPEVVDLYHPQLTLALSTTGFV